MHRDTLGEIIFWASVAFAFLVYGFSAPEELPWAGSVLSVLAVRFPVWGYFVEVFAGHYVALAVVSAAIAGGLLGALVNCYVGWRFGVATVLVWVMSPLVWNRAVTGAPELFATAGVVTVLWVINGIALLVTERARSQFSMRRAENPSATLKGGALFERETRNYLVAGYVALVASVLFAGFSLYRHDYRLGEAAGAYAKVVTGPSASAQEWSARWDVLTPYLGSRDRFIPIMRHAFADEARTLARRLMEENRPKEAWDLLWCVYTVMDPGNDKVLIQMNEIYREGYQPDGDAPLGRASVTEPCLRKAINMTDEGHVDLSPGARADTEEPGTQHARGHQPDPKRRRPCAGRDGRADSPGIRAVLQGQPPQARARHREREQYRRIGPIGRSRHRRRDRR